MKDHNSNREPSSRRQFIRTSGKAVIGGVLISQVSLSEKTFAANADTLRVGLIGCGGRGTGAAAQALAADQNVILTAMADVFENRLKGSLNTLKKEAGARVQVAPDHCFVGVDAYQKLIDSGVDVVLLAAPPGFRPVHLRAAVAAGKHIFCEKPMATDAPGVRSVVESVGKAKQKNLALVAGFCWRYEPGRRSSTSAFTTVPWVKSGDSCHYLGPVKPMPPASQRPSGMGDLEWQLHNWYNFAWLSGDGLVEQACHSVDKIAWAMNGLLPIKAVATGGRQIPNNEGNIFDHIDVFYEYENGVRAFMAQRQINNCYGDNSDYLLGATGTGTIKGWNAPIITGKERWRYSGAKKDMYQVEHNELFASIRKGAPINDGVWMANSTLMAIMGRMAAYTGQEITWEMALNSQEMLVPEKLDWSMNLPIAPMAVPGKTKFV